MSLNKVMLIGNLGADPEIRHTQSGTAVCELRIATTERRKTGDTWADHTEWHRVVVWSKRAENCAKYLTKGSKVYVEGRLSTRAWDDKDGNKRYTTEIVADDVQFLDGKRDGGSRGGQQGGSSDYESQRKTGWSGTGEDLPGYDYGTHRGGPDDDIPF